MSKWSRQKSKAGGGGIKTIASAASIYVSDESDSIYLTGTATVTSLTGHSATRGRNVRFYQSDTGTTTFTNSPGTTTAGQMDLGGLDSANAVIGPTDFLELHYRTDGTWVRIATANN